MDNPISGIQQIGVGVKDCSAAWAWYRQWFGLDTPVFDDEAEAGLMTRYTGDVAQKRRAVLALNMQGGGGFEIWQYTTRDPQPPAFDLTVGDYGIFAGKIKCRDVGATYKSFKEAGLNVSEAMSNDPAGNPGFFVYDPYGNLFHVVSGNGWFSDYNLQTGGLYGAIIGVSDIDRSMKIYADVLGYSEVVFDETGAFDDLKGLHGGEHTLRRVLLRCPTERQGAFSKLLGPGNIELWQVQGREPRKILSDRFWGDLGFIHLCFDVLDMRRLEADLGKHGFKFTVDSRNSFDMGEAAGHFTYVEDPDGTLIEFVETHRVPIVKKWGWYLDLQKRKNGKPLPNWMVKSLRFNRVKS